MNTDEKLEQSCIVKERGTQYFKVRYSRRVIIAFLSPCHELIMMITASVIPEWCSWYSLWCFTGKTGGEGVLKKQKPPQSWNMQRTNSAGSSLCQSCLLYLQITLGHTLNSSKVTVFKFLLWDSAVNEQHSFG